MLVTPSLLERMRNNYMVIEVWDKKTSAQDDQVCKGIGIGGATISLLINSLIDVHTHCCIIICCYIETYCIL